jgi:uncharacterized protein (TIGR02996 family)
MIELDELLARWRAAPNRELADLIVEVGAVRATTVPWDAVDDAPHPAAITKLLERVLERGSVKARDRVAAMAKWPRDPRIDRWVAEQYADPPTTSTGARPFWTKLLPLAQAIVDTQAANTILKVREGWRDTIPWQAFLAGHVERARAKLVAAKDAPFDADTRATIEHVREELRASTAAALPQRSGDASSLLAAVLANPDDDAARVVLGDVLLEQGDPRGELIALQLLDEPTPAQQKRVKELVKHHTPHLLGALHGVLRDFTFTRGFVSTATLKAGNARALESALERALGDPLWGTVEHLENGTPELLAQPTMRALRSLRGSKARLADVAKLPRLERFTTGFTGTEWVELASDPDAFPKLVELDVFLEPEIAIKVVKSPLFARLAKLQLRVEPQNFPVERTTLAFALLPMLRSLALPDATLRFVRNRDKDYHCAFHFAGGNVTVTRSENAPYAYQQAVTQDLERGLALLASAPA